MNIFNDMQAHVFLCIRLRMNNLLLHDTSSHIRFRFEIHFLLFYKNLISFHIKNNIEHEKWNLNVQDGEKA